MITLPIDASYATLCIVIQVMHCDTSDARDAMKCNEMQEIQEMQGEIQGGIKQLCKIV